MYFKAVVVCLVYLIQGSFATILISQEIERGTCDLEIFKADILLDCDITNVKINIVTKHDNNLLAQCSKSRDMLRCHGDITENTANNNNNTMTFSTKFNHTEHAGNKLWINSTCSNGPPIQESIQLKPCITGFNVSSQHNTSHMTILCEHSSFKASLTGIHIHGKNTLATCSWDKTSQKHRCTSGATALPNGVQYITPYKSGMRISCSLDGQKIPISIQNEGNAGNRAGRKSRSQFRNRTGRKSRSKFKNNQKTHITKRRTSLQRAITVLRCERKAWPVGFSALVVKPVFRGHLREVMKVATQDRWPLIPVCPVDSQSIQI